MRAHDKILVGRAGFEPAKLKNNRFTVCPRWPLEYLPKNLINEPMEGLPPTSFGINFSSQTYQLSLSLKNVMNFISFLSRWRDSNPRPADYKSAALAS